MKKFLRNIILGLFVVACILSCKNNVELNPGFTTISLRMKNNPRTIYPDFAVEDFTDFVLQGRKAGTKNWTISYSWDNYEEISAARLSIDYGTYDFQLTAKENETTFASEILSSVVISETASNNLSFVMTVNEYSVDGTGSFNFTLNWAKNLNVSRIQAFLSPLDIDDDDSYEFDSEGVLEKQELTSFVEFEDKCSAVYSASDIVSGTYVLHMILQGDGYLNEISRHEEVIYITNNMSSTVERNLDENIDDNLSITYELNGGSFSSGVTESLFRKKYSINLPLPQKESYAFMGWYKTSDFEAGTKITGWEKGSLTDNITIYARWGKLISVSELDDYLESAEDVCEVSISDENPDFSVIRTALLNYPEKHIYLSLDECSALTEITDSAFEGCTSLSSVSIPSGIVSIGTNSFKDCTGLKEVNYDSEVFVNPETNGNSFFNSGSGYESLFVVNIGKNVTFIPDYLFYGAKVTDVIFTYDSKCKSIGKSSFELSKLESITLPETVTEIGSNSFASTELSSFLIPDSVTSIKDSAFSGCTGLSTITIPETITSMGGSVFSGCTELTEIQFNAKNCSLSSSNSPFKGAGSEENSVTVNIGRQVKTIPDYFLSDTACVSEVIFDQDCNCTSIGVNAFCNCTELSSFLIPDSVTSIKDSAFSGCTGLSTITIPETIASMGDSVFSGCTELTEIQFNAKNCSLSSSNSPFKGAGSEENSVTVKIGSQIKSIPDYFLCNFAYVAEVIFDQDCNCTSIGANAFCNCTGLSSFLIPDSVTSIKDSAFSGCTGLSTITIPETITSMGGSVFSGCTELTEIQFNAKNCSLSSLKGAGSNENSVTVKIGSQVKSIPDNFLCNFAYVSEVIFDQDCNCTSIGADAFYKCTGLTEITIPESVTSIGSYAFYGCTGFTSMTLSGSVESIGERAFYGCTGLSTITISESVAIIGSYAFSDCTELTEIQFNAKNCSCYSDSFSRIGSYKNTVTVKIGSQVEKIPSKFLANYSYTDSSHVSEVTFDPNSSCTSIGVGAFYNCVGLKKLIIPDSVESIGNGAFYGCTGLTNMTLPDSVTIIENGTFQECGNLASIAISSSLTKIGDSAFEECRNLTAITVPDSVTSIGNRAFYEAGLNSITLPDSIMTIGSYAFYGCTGLTNIILPDSVTTIENGTFMDCFLLTNITIPETVTTIGSYAFEHCSGLTKITIPNSVTTIGSCAFESCSGLTKITIPESVTSIGSSAFSSCKGLTEITIPESVTSIGSSAFSSCKGLTEITIPESVTSIEGYAFYGCTGLTEITIPESVTSIGYYAFKDCTGLKEITIPESVASIDYSAFSGCTGLTKIQYNAKNCSLSCGNYDYPFSKTGSETSSVTVKIGSQVENIPDYFLYNSVYISEIIFDQNSCCTNIGQYAFSGCTGLTDVTIPALVASIGRYAFYGCTSLTDITIPASVASIGKYAFNGCSALTSATFEVTSGWYCEGVTYYVSIQWHKLVNCSIDLSGSASTCASYLTDKSISDSDTGNWPYAQYYYEFDWSRS